MDSEQPELNEDQRWEVRKLFLARSDHAADFTRAVLFTAAGAGMGFVLQQQPQAISLGCWRTLSVLLFGTAAGLIFVSWDSQKRKASKAFKENKTSVRDFRMPAKTGFRINFLDPDFWEANLNIDRLAALCIALGAGVYLVTKW
jgi:hypothetical protein